VAVKLIGKNKKRFKSTREEQDALELQLPKNKSVPSKDPRDYSWLIYGRKKIGKTTLAAQFEDALFLMCEPGGKALSIRQVGIRNWSEFRGYVDLAIEDEDTRTIIVDTTDLAYAYCLEYVCDKLAIEHPADEAYGKGWNAVRKEFVSVINKLLHSGKGVVFISHSKDEEFKTRHSDTFHKTVSSMPGQAKDVLEGLVDIWANYDYDGRRRVLIIGGSEEVDAGNRIEGRFVYPDGSPIDRIPMGSSPKEGYKNLIAAFNNHGDKEAQPKEKHGLKIKKH
jgi:hypothetical protein